MAELNDPSRLAALRAALLRTDADAILDACVARAAELSGAPIALVSLVVRHIQLFRAHRGLPPELAVSCATSRSNSFCQLVVRDEAPLVVEDGLEDPRVPKELVEQYSIRAYAGVPLRVRGQVLGSLCVLDVVPRRFAPGLIQQLATLAAEVTERLDQLPHDEAAPGGGSPEEGLVRMAQAARLLEHAMNAIAPAIAQAHAAVPALAGEAAAAGSSAGVGRDSASAGPFAHVGRDSASAGPFAEPLRADLRAAVGCYRDMLAIAQELAEDAAGLARGALAEASSEIAEGTCALMRDMAEIGPLIRLAERVLDGTLGDGDAARAALVARDALAAHETASAAVRRILAALQCAAPALGQASGRAAAREVS